MLTLPPVAAKLVNLSTLLLTIEVLATIAFAMSGLIEAVRKRMDIVGVFAVTFVSAFGGGTLRDILLDQRPFFWVQNQEYIWLILAMTIIVPLRIHFPRRKIMRQLTELADAFGLGLFAVSGTSVALVAGMSEIVAIMMGTITAVFGGVIRDVLCNEIPKAFHDHRPYALCAFVGSACFLGMHHLPALEAEISTTLGVICVTGLRLLALWFDWRIPAWPVRQEVAAGDDGKAPSEP